MYDDKYFPFFFQSDLGHVRLQISIQAIAKHWIHNTFFSLVSKSKKIRASMEDVHLILEIHNSIEKRWGYPTIRMHWPILTETQYLDPEYYRCQAAYKTRSKR